MRRRIYSKSHIPSTEMAHATPPPHIFYCATPAAAFASTVWRNGRRTSGTEGESGRRRIRGSRLDLRFSTWPEHRLMQHRHGGTVVSYSIQLILTIMFPVRACANHCCLQCLAVPRGSHLWPPAPPPFVPQQNNPSHASRHTRTHHRADQPLAEHPMKNPEAGEVDGRRADTGDPQQVSTRGPMLAAVGLLGWLCDAAIAALCVGSKHSRAE